MSGCHGDCSLYRINSILTPYNDVIRREETLLCKSVAYRGEPIDIRSRAFAAADHL